MNARASGMMKTQNLKGFGKPFRFIFTGGKYVEILQECL